MKNSVRFFGLIAVVAIIGLTAVSCDSPAGGSGPGSQPGPGQQPGPGGNQQPGRPPLDLDGQLIDVQMPIISGNQTAIMQSLVDTMGKMFDQSLQMQHRFTQWQAEAGVPADLRNNVINGQPRTRNTLTDTANGTQLPGFMRTNATVLRGSIIRSAEVTGQRPQIIDNAEFAFTSAVNLQQRNQMPANQATNQRLSLEDALRRIQIFGGPEIPMPPQGHSLQPVITAVRGIFVDTLEQAGMPRELATDLVQQNQDIVEFAGWVEDIQARGINISMLPERNFARGDSRQAKLQEQFNFLAATHAIKSDDKNLYAEHDIGRRS